MKRLLTLTLLLACILQVPAAPIGKAVLSVLGDSYSTFDGYIPQGNEPWYPTANKATNDVRQVEQTWWWQVINEGGYRLGVNESYSGSTVSYTGYRGDDYRERSFITRLPRIAPPDVLLIFGATNDSWCGAPIGDFKYDSLTRGHFYEFRPALGYLVQEAKRRMPGTHIVFIINSELKDDITKSIITVCKKFGVDYLLLHDIEKQAGHPSIQGMKAIKEQVLQKLQPEEQNE